jgi:hypothetical protein
MKRQNALGTVTFSLMDLVRSVLQSLVQAKPVLRSWSLPTVSQLASGKPSGSCGGTFSFGNKATCLELELFL